MKRGQTSSEYLILVAAIIVISLVVVSIIGDFPKIGEGLNVKQNNALLQSQNIGISYHSVSSSGTKLVIQNNNLFEVSIDQIEIEGVLCSTNLPIKLKIGEKYTHECSLIKETDSSKYNLNISITYTNLALDATYSQSGLKLIGDVKEFQVEGANQAAIISLISPQSGNYSGGTEIKYTVSDDNKTNTLIAEYYYSLTPGSFENLIASENLRENCFGESPVLESKNCTYT